MRLDLFEELGPVCPRCLHGGAGEHPVVIAERSEMRSGQLWHGLLHCSNTACWIEFPVVDGVPILVPDPPGFVSNASDYMLWRLDLPAKVESCLADGFGAGHAFDTMRQHLSLYAGDHFADWTGNPGISCAAGTIATGLDLIGEINGPMIDLGCATGRGVWELAAGGEGPVLGADFNIAMLRLAQHLMLEGSVTFPCRRVGLVYTPAIATLPEANVSSNVDFWAMDAMAQPFSAGKFGFATAINLVDCVAGPTELVAETARLLTPGGAALLTTPYDWAANATEPARWMGGHSQRGPQGGASEPVLRATLEQFGLKPFAERDDIPWHLRLHDRAEMHYQLHMLACRKL